ncbi:beta-lactamase-like protein [Rhypophila sp. PSN 637]
MATSTNALQITANLGWQVAANRLVAATAPLLPTAARIIPSRYRAGTGQSRTLSTSRERSIHQHCGARNQQSRQAVIYSPQYSASLFQPPRTFPSRSPYSTAAPSAPEPIIEDVFEKVTGTWQYLVSDPATKTAVIIDPVLDYDPATWSISTTTADALLALIKEKGYTISWILETHAHADHLTSASYLQKRLAQEQGEANKPAIGIGKRIGKVQSLFGQRYGIPEEEYTVVFDKLFEDDEVFNIGELKAQAMHLPGHTPDHMGYKIGDNVFCGDSIFNADIGTARCDFPGGSAHQLYTSGRRLLSLPDHVKIWTGHDYPPEGGRAPLAFMTVAEHREKNKHLREGIQEDAFVAMRNERDASLGAPRLLHQSLQTNIRAGHLPRPTEKHGDRLFHVPVKVKGGGGVGEW